MWWRVPARDWDSVKGEPNRLALRALVADEAPTGLLAYSEGEPVGWCSVAPRADFSRLNRSRVLAAVDEQPVWSIVCFFIARRHRNRGVGSALLKAAAELAAEGGAQVVEGYPVDKEGQRSPDPFVYTGTLAMFRAAGFREVDRRSATRPIMRKVLQPDAS
jgi:GNAT superfamily N-acetyltransferase